MTSKPFIKYPRGIGVICTVQALSMFAFSTIQSLLVLYVINQLNFSQSQAYELFAAFGALIFGAPVLGGYIGGHFLGHKRAIYHSCAYIIAGLIAISFHNKMSLLLGLAAFVIGTCLYVPNAYVLLGRLYQHDDPMRESGFTLSYIGMNLGALIAIALVGVLQQSIGFEKTFLIAVTPTILVFILLLLKSEIFADADLISRGNTHTVEPCFKRRTQGAVLTFVALPVFAELLNHAKTCDLLLMIIGGLAACFVIGLALRQSPSGRNKLLVFLALSIISIGFWALYMLSPSALTVFIENNVNRHIFNATIPTPSVMGLNPLFIITIGPLLSLLWLYLGHKNKSPSIPAKFSFGILLMGCGYLVLILGIKFANHTGFTAMSWIVLSYFLQTVGELFVAPIGNAMVGRLAPQKFEALMMGIWQMSNGVASALSAYLAIETVTKQEIIKPLLTNARYSHAFLQFGLISVSIGLLATLLTPLLRKQL